MSAAEKPRQPMMPTCRAIGLTGFLCGGRMPCSWHPPPLRTWLAWRDFGGAAHVEGPYATEEGALVAYGDMCELLGPSQDRGSLRIVYARDEAGAVDWLAE